MPRKIAIVVGYGQSNEEGSANTVIAREATQFGRAGSFGGVSRSPFGVLARILTNEGHAVRLLNYAKGGTGCLPQWTGYIRTWAPSTFFQLSGYALPTVPNGFRYRNITVNTSTSTVEPTWPTVVNATVVEGGITWRCEVAQAQDTDGRVSLPGDTAYDPNGYIAPMIAGIADAKAKGFEVWVCSSGHQGDLFVPKVAVVTAMANLMRRAITTGADRVYLGVSNRDWTGGTPSTVWNNPGTVSPTLFNNMHDLRKLVRAALSDQPKVRLGPDLSDIAINMTDLEGAIRIHMNDIGAAWAGKKWFDAIALDQGL